MSYSAIAGSARGWSYARPGLLLQQLAAAAWLMLARSRERQILATMDARELRDIGVTPYEAGTEARKPFWRA
jgi:uncharacterized protein YjiS (DUF1127 family)